GGTAGPGRRRGGRPRWSARCRRRDGFDQAGVAVAADDGDVSPARRPIGAARGLEGPAQVADPGEAVLGAGGDAGHRPVAGAVVEAGVETGRADGSGRPWNAALPVPPRDGVAVAAGRIFADAQKGPGPMGAETRPPF